MATGRPQKIAINHDDYHASQIGRTAEGRQFFLTTPFDPATDTSSGMEYIALFQFDLEGNLVESKIDELGPRGSFSNEEAEEKYQARLSGLGEVKYCRIEVKPFSVQYKGAEIGLIVREPEDEEDVWAVELLPGNYMAFFEPWDSGDYDT